MRVTLYGLAPEGCTAAECGDRVMEAPAAPPGQAARLALSAVYPKAGRYIARVEVSLLLGSTPLPPCRAATGSQQCCLPQAQ